MKWNLILIIIILILVNFLFNFYKSNPEVKITRTTDTLKTTDTVFIKIYKTIKVKAKEDTATQIQAKKIIELKKDSLEKLISFIIEPVDTTIEEQEAKIKINYIPIKRFLKIDSDFPKIIEKIIIKDSVNFLIEKNNISELIIVGSVGIVIGFILSIFAF